MSYLRLMNDPTVKQTSSLWANTTHSIDTVSLHSAALPVRPTDAGGSAAFPTTNLAIYVPVRVQRPVKVLKLWVGTGGGANNIDLGVYNSSGTRLSSTGNIAKTAAIAEQVVDVTDFSIAPGLYYMALVQDGVVGFFYRFNPAAPQCAAVGVLTEALGSAVLPATATWAVNQTLAYMPLMGMLVEGTVA